MFLKIFPSVSVYPPLPVKSSSMLMKPSEVELVVSTENPGSPSSGSYAYPIPKELFLLPICGHLYFLDVNIDYCCRTYEAL